MKQHLYLKKMIENTIFLKKKKRINEIKKKKTRKKKFKLSNVLLKYKVYLQMVNKKLNKDSNVKSLYKIFISFCFKLLIAKIK